MADWAMYLDDSATHGSVLDANFQPIPTRNDGFLPVTSAGGIYVNESREKIIRRDVNSLRERIARELKLDELPDLHMSEMWGKELSRTRKDNPYRKASLEQRFKYGRAAFDILFKNAEKGILRTCGVSLEIGNIQQVLMQTVAPGELYDFESAILKYLFPDCIAEFYGVLFNPLIRMLMHCIIAGSYVTGMEGNKFSVTYDSYNASKGFSISDGMIVLKSNKRFPRLKSVNESSPHRDELLQLADVAAYNVFRSALTAYRVKNKLRHATDPGIVAALRKRTTLDIAMPLPKGNFESAHFNELAMLQITYAAQVLRDRHPDRAARYLVDPNHYHIPISPGQQGFGAFQLFTNEIHARWKNGERPPL